MIEIEKFAGFLYKLTTKYDFSQIVNETSDEARLATVYRVLYI
jgi:hypothetical protein